MTAKLFVVVILFDTHTYSIIYIVACLLLQNWWISWLKNLLFETDTEEVELKIDYDAVIFEQTQIVKSVQDGPLKPGKARLLADRNSVFYRIFQ